jgi:hypothetical protein
MDKLIEDLNLTTLKQNGENLMKVSLSSDQTPSPVIHFPSDDEVFCVDGRLNHHLTEGSTRLFA